MSAERQAATLVDELYKFRNQFVPVFGIERIGEKSNLVKNELGKVLLRLQNLESECGKTFYFLQRGRALNILSEYSKECEECLSKAVKRDPSLIEAWNLLGETFWKKSDTIAAKDCFEGSLKREKNKVGLRSLSMVLRQLKCAKAEEAITNVMKSVEYAKNAVELDASDGMSWYIQGNAHLSLFFATDQSSKTLCQALSSYAQAEKVDADSKYNPDLHFNRAQAYRYEEAYSSALEGWREASKLDPQWPEPKLRINELQLYLKKVSLFVAQKGKLKSKRLQGLIKSIDDKCLGPYKNEGYMSGKEKKMLENNKLNKMEDGVNVGKVITGRVVCSFADLTLVPFTFAMVDANGDCCAVTVYNLAQGKGVIIGDSVAIPEPHFSRVSVPECSGNSETWTFVSVRVDNPTKLVVNSKLLMSDHCAFTKAKMGVRNT